jgi:SARP family transcriptional regulator, regulator of embCAB operon
VGPSATLRLYLSGELFLERSPVLLRSGSLPGLQGRVVLAMLAATDGAVPNDALADELWGDAPPASAGAAVRALVSKLRVALLELGPDAAGITHVGDGYRWDRPSATWIDVSAAHDAIHRAEAARDAGDLEGAIGWGRVTAAIAARPLLPGAEGPWVTRTRRELEATYLRALDHLSAAWLDVGAADQAARDALRAVSIDPLREPSLRLAMRALAARGDRAGALREFERFRRLMRESLGADPSPQTQELHVAILRGAAV